MAGRRAPYVPSIGLEIQGDEDIKTKILDLTQSVRFVSTHNMFAFIPISCRQEGIFIVFRNVT
jgi:hypothetical protein